jgi:hypothetical protein
MRSTSILSIAAAMAAVLALGNVSGPASGEADKHATAASAAAGTASGDAVRAWNTIAVDTLIALPGTAGGTPFGAQVHLAMVQGAVYDAVNATEPKHYRPYLLNRRFSARASKEAAVAAAASGVLRHLVATMPNLSAESRTAVLATLANHHRTALAAVPGGPFENQGVAAGEAAAAAMIAARADDGRFGPSQWVPNTAPGHWWPQLTPAGAQVLDPTPWIGGVDPFLVQSATQFRTAGPVSLASDTWAKEFNEVKSLGAVDSTTRTPTQTYIAKWWQSTPVRSWNEVARDLADRHDLDALDTARLFAMTNLSGADASITCWNDKYHWDFWRPWNAIPRAAEDGNPATAPQAGWTPLIAAPYPEHPSGHLCLDGVHVGILQKFFGDTVPGGFQITSISTLLAPAPADPRVRTFSRFSQVIDEIIEARIWAGLHYRTGDVQAEILGRGVADYAAANYFQPVGRGRTAPRHGSGRR